MHGALQPETTYQATGVDVDQAHAALRRMTERFKGTWPSKEGMGSVKLGFEYFANVIDIGGVGLAICTDGVGSKALIAQMTGKYDTIGIDCVAMNVNDLICAAIVNQPPPTPRWLLSMPRLRCKAAPA